VNLAFSLMVQDNVKDVPSGTSHLPMDPITVILVHVDLNPILTALIVHIVALDKVLFLEESVYLALLERIRLE